MLLLKKHLVHLVRVGKKRQTIRLWSKALLRAGMISYTPGLGRMRITGVDILPSLGALSEEDARLDGFDSLGELLGEIRKIYGATVKGRVIYRIKFEWPIDEAGEKLVLVKGDGELSGVRKAKETAAVPEEKLDVAKRKSQMTAQQRELLRSYALSRVPKKK